MEEVDELTQIWNKMHTSEDFKLFLASNYIHWQKVEALRREDVIKAKQETYEKLEKKCKTAYLVGNKQYERIKDEDLHPISTNSTP